MAEAAPFTTTVTATIKNFSDESIHRPGALTVISDTSLKKESVIEFLVTSFYGNGDVEANRGHVSIVFKCGLPLIFKSHHHFNLTCVAAVEDSLGSLRFVRSFTFPYDPEAQSAIAEDVLGTFKIDRYVARKALLEEADLLLPGDCLSLRLEVTLQNLSPDDFVDDYDRAEIASFVIEEDPEGDVIRLSLDSDVAARLREESEVFAALCDTDMIERKRGYVKLVGERARVLRQAYRILAGARSISFDSIDEIVMLYLFADKYGIPALLRACREFFRKILYVEDAWGTFDQVADRVEKITNVATVFNDSDLREIVDVFLTKWREELPREGSRQKGIDGKVDFGNLKMEYTGSSPYLYFELGNKDEQDKGSDFSFYS